MASAELIKSFPTSQITVTDSYANSNEGINRTLRSIEPPDVVGVNADTDISNLFDMPETGCG